MNMYVNADEEKAMHFNKQTHAHETSAEEKKPTQRRKRKSNVEKSLEVVMKKFQESSNEDFKR